MRNIRYRRRNLGRIALNIDQQGQLVEYAYYRISKFEQVQGERYWRPFRRDLYRGTNIIH